MKISTILVSKSSQILRLLPKDGHKLSGLRKDKKIQLTGWELIKTKTWLQQEHLCPYHGKASNGKVQLKLLKSAIPPRAFRVNPFCLELELPGNHPKVQSWNALQLGAKTTRSCARLSISLLRIGNLAIPSDSGLKSSRRPNHLTTSASR